MFWGKVNQKYAARHCINAHKSEIRRNRNELINQMREIFAARGYEYISRGSTDSYDPRRSSTYMRAYGQDQLQIMS